MSKRRQSPPPQSPSLPPTLEQGWLVRWFRDSETILVARVTQLGGFITAIGAGLDWTRIFSLDFSKGIVDKQLMTTGILIFAQGVLVELARRRRTSADPVQ